MNLITVEPSTIINDSFLVRDPFVLSLLESVKPDEVFVNFTNEDYVFDASPDLQQSAFLHVVTESVFEYPHNNFSEKTWKPILSLRPFVIVGVPGSIKNLHNLGFKTFNHWWDESYDTIEDSVQRLKAIVDIVESIANNSVEENCKLLLDMKSVLEYNRSHYYGEFRNHWINQIHKKCQQNLLPR